MPYRSLLALISILFISLLWYHDEVTKNKLATFERVINGNNIKTWTLSAGIPSNQPCLFISGAGESAKFWSYHFLENIVNAGYYTITFDHRDTGLSSAIDFEKNSYTLMDLTKDAVRVLDQYDISKAHIIGHSMGGAIAQLIAIHYPDRVLSITAISANTADNKYPTKNTIDELFKNKPTNNFEDSLPGFMHSWKILNGDIELDKKMAISYTRDLYHRSYHQIDVTCNHTRCQQRGIENLSESLRKIKVPTLVIHGEKDPLIPVESGIANAKAIPNAKIEIIPNMGHMIFNKNLEKDLAKILIKQFKSTDCKKLKK